MDLDDEVGRQRVHDGHADAVQAAGDLVARAAELAAGVEDRVDDLERALSGLLLLVRRDAASVVGDGDLVALVDGHIDAIARAVHRLVDRVVEDLADEVVEAADVGRSDVHAGAATHRLESLEDLDVLGAVRRGRLAAVPADDLLAAAGLHTVVVLLDRHVLSLMRDRRGPGAHTDARSPRRSSNRSRSARPCGRGGPPPSFPTLNVARSS